MPHLFEPLQIREVTFRNRIAVSPMCQYSSTDGYANEWHFIHLVSRAVGGAGLVFTEAAAVEPRGRISPQDLGIWSNEHIEDLAKIVTAIEKYGAVAGIQLAHAGRKASTAKPSLGGKPVDESQDGWGSIVSSSAIPFSSEYPTPEALTIEDIQEVRDAFVQAAKRSVEAGFKVIQIHAAHGYSTSRCYEVQ
jgi:2,4-dienoyl-CoA reductase-like NADH-dependent reductase (Old Yellow Enzyme family)